MSQIWIIPALPLLGFLINGVFGKRWGKCWVSLIGPGAVGLAFLQSVNVFVEMMNSPNHLVHEQVFTWIKLSSLQVNMAFQVDLLSGYFLLFITGIGFLIHVYSVGYMRAEEGYYRFFAYMNLFVFFMLVLVLGDNLLVLFVGWEGVGLCSYLLIGYYYEKHSAADAAKKAFVVNRVGDFGFLAGVMMIFLVFGSLNFTDINGNAAKLLPFDSLWATLITLFLFLGATGKSAQIPLFVWLPDAMEGPTPVSALIHAATMVTSGLYLVARLSHVFVLAPFTMHVIAAVGITTALLAALIAITQTDIKRVLAYSTVSQLGFMFLAMGVGAFGAGIFHVLTHAFFKALLFLCSGSVIHALHHEQDMRKMGDLKGKLPKTYATMLIGTIAIAGIPPFAGFFSKDEILWKAFSSPWGHPVLWAVGLLTAMITSFYMFRLIFMTFYGDSRVDGHTAKHLHESPAVMTVPLMILAVLSVFGGFLGFPHVFHLIPNGIENYFHGFFGVIPNVAGVQASATLELGLMVASVVLSMASAIAAFKIYNVNLNKATQLKHKFATMHLFSLRKFFVDEIYHNLIILPLCQFSRLVLWKLTDDKIIDGSVDSSRDLTRAAGVLLRPLQNGILQIYALAFACGTLVLIWFLIFK